MSLPDVSIKAPGSMMIMGEHAVLHGQPAIVAAIDRSIIITLSGRSDKLLVIDSSYGHVKQSIYETPESEWAQWISFIIQSFINDFPELNTGVSVHIESTFEGAIGLSSSTAVTVALLYALAQWIAPESEDQQKKQWVFEEALYLMQQAQKVASGAALQAIIYGGLRYFDPEDQVSENMDVPLSCYLVYCGYKTPTEKVVTFVKEKFQDQPIELAHIYQKMGEVVKNSYAAIRKCNEDAFYLGINQYYLLQKALGVSDAKLQSMIALSEQSPLTKAAKISGAGLGDCILVMGEIDQSLWQAMPDIQMIEVQISKQGVAIC